MARRENRYYPFLLTVLAALLLFPSLPSAGQGPGDLRTHYAAIHYPDDRLLAEFAGKITRDGRLSAAADRPRVLAAVKRDVDRIVFRVRTLLDMYPLNFRFAIRIYPSYVKLGEAWREAGKFGPSPVAFYSHSNGTVHVTVERLSAGILAHEIAHAVINSYFDSPPPAKAQEILSRYVDTHLWDALP
ncbi:MAG: hypothetical protein ACE5EI_06160 [Thermodesulfobacteriota bacterium]